MHEHLTPAGGTVAACEDEAACVPQRCDLCLADLPADQLAVPDAQDYVRHFCGLDCLAEWQRRNNESSAEKGTPPTS